MSHAQRFGALDSFCKLAEKDQVAQQSDGGEIEWVHHYTDAVRIKHTVALTAYGSRSSFPNKASVLGEENDYIKGDGKD